MKKFQNEEEAAAALCDLYRSCGYAPYKMRRFEEYDFYAENKDFLLSENLLTFTDRSGKLMALKPDVTLSVVRGVRRGEKKKVCYSEKVYRPGRGGGSFIEITQVGVENVGAIDVCQKCEVLALAAKSLCRIAGSFRLCVFDTFLFTFFAARATNDAEVKRKLGALFSKKNRGEIEALASAAASKKSADALKKLAVLSALDGAPETVFPALRALTKDREFLLAVDELEAVTNAVGEKNLRIDPSVIADTRYYGGIVFCGYVPGAPDAALSGGQYDPLMKKMGKEQSALGFAVYLDKLPPLLPPKYDADLLVLYDGGTDPRRVLETVFSTAEKGKTAYTARSAPAGFTSGKTLDLRTERGGAPEEGKERTDSD